MTDVAIITALQKRAEIEAKITESEARTKRLKEQLSDIKTFINQWEKFSGRPSPDLSNLDTPHSKRNLSQNDTDSILDLSTRQNSKKEEVAQATKKILEASTAPLSRSELYLRLKEQGLRMNGSKPEMVLSTMLWRSRDDFGITRLKSGGYWISGRPIPNGDQVEDEDEDDGLGD